jgi:asparagine N-glycosylation enzyme membrane subunit Stt3
MFKTLIFRTNSELQKEKQKDYRNVVVIQIIIIVLGLTLSEFLLSGPESPPAKLVTTIFSFFGAAYAFLLWDLLRNFTRSRLIINLYLGVLSGIVVTGVLVEFPYYNIIEVPDRQLYLLTIHGLLFPIEVTVIGFAIRDIFTGEYLTPDKLWGSACVFLMIGISFGSLYDLICIIKPGSLGEPLDLGLTNYSACVTYSFSILGGLDPGHPNASRLIRNISVIEAVWSNLFVVLIIGKLMGLPRLPKPDLKQE